MKYAKLGDTEIPAIALGTWSWGTGINGGNQIFGNSYGEEDLKPVFELAMKQGFNLWDTAAVYGMGAAEKILGSYIKDNPNVILSTKFTPLGLQTRKAVGRFLKKSCCRLGVEQVDLYWVHSPANVQKWTKELIPLLKRGKAKHVGVSNHNLEQVKEADHILKQVGFKLSAVQNHYSLLYRVSEETGILKWCEENQVVFFSYMVLEQGALTGKYDGEHPFKRGTRRAKAFPVEVLNQIQGLLKGLRDLGEQYKATPAQITIAWALAKGTVPIIGVTKKEQVEDLSKAFEIDLTAKEVEGLERLAKDAGVNVKASWEN